MSQSNGYRFERAKISFWMNFGLDARAATAATLCFPQGWPPFMSSVDPNQLIFPRGLPNDFPILEPVTKCPDKASNAKLFMNKYAREYVTDPRHPAYWHEQGYDFDDMANKAVSVNAMLKVQERVDHPHEESERTTVAMQVLQTHHQEHVHIHPQEDMQTVSDEKIDDGEPFDPAEFPRYQR